MVHSKQMDQYRFLLEEIGILDHGIPPDDIIEIPPEPQFYVEEYNETSFNSCVDTDYHLDHDQEISHRLNCKKKHRYSRKARFKSVVLQLVGASGETPDNVVKIIHQNLKPTVKSSKIWNRIWKLLKKNNFKGYYNRMPQLIKLTTGVKPMGVSYEAIQNILQDFDNFHYKFNNHLAEKWSRKYFPNLRFVALKLLSQHGITFPYKVPLVRTVRKKKYLESLYSEFF